MSFESQHVHASAPGDKQTPKLWESHAHGGLQNANCTRNGNSGETTQHNEYDSSKPTGPMQTLLLDEVICQGKQ